MKKIFAFVFIVCLSLSMLASCGKPEKRAAGPITDGGYALIYRNMEPTDIAFCEDCRLIYTYFDGIRLYLQFEIKGSVESAPQMYLLLNGDETKYLPEVELTNRDNEIVCIWNIPALNTVKDCTVCLTDGGISKVFSVTPKDLKTIEIEAYYEEIYIHDYVSASSSCIFRMTPHFAVEIKEIYIEEKETGEIYSGHLIEEADGVLTVVFERPMESGKKYVFHFWNQRTFASILFSP